ncbi:hypothetical protein [Brucella rhizosphaerae]|uniref:hypothetical protein n=1 Tax=Brucella rhizosphaerae TaxID=571254 RepID=UPI00142D826D|nr:hypothetical protein [Brucella rhizosphaerae]
MFELTFKVLFDDIVVHGAACLPIGLIPEQRLVALMWDDVINDLGNLDAINSLASNAERIVALICDRRLVPSGRIATITSAAASNLISCSLLLDCAEVSRPEGSGL